METYNLSASTDTILEDMKFLTQISWFYSLGIMAAWDNIYSIPLTLVPTKYGLCFSTNMVNSSELLNINEYKSFKIISHFLFACNFYRTSKDFHYKREYENTFYNPIAETYSKPVKGKFPLHPLHHKFLVSIHFQENIYDIYNDFMALNGYRIIMHNTDEFPNDDRNMFIVQFDEHLTLTLTATFTEGHESLETLDVDEYF